MTDKEKADRIESIIRECICIVLRNEGYTADKIRCALQWNNQEILPLIEKAKKI